MSACEKCWRLAGGDPDRYRALLAEVPPCTPEEQAGPGATLCVPCNRMTVHQYTHVCMVCDQDDVDMTDDECKRFDERLAALAKCGKV